MLVLVLVLVLLAICDWYPLFTLTLWLWLDYYDLKLVFLTWLFGIVIGIGIGTNKFEFTVVFWLPKLEVFVHVDVFEIFEEVNNSFLVVDSFCFYFYFYLFILWQISIDLYFLLKPPKNCILFANGVLNLANFIVFSFLYAHVRCIHY